VLELMFSVISCVFVAGDCEMIEYVCRWLKLWFQ